MTITLEAIEEQHARVAKMIEAFKAQPGSTERHIDAVTIPLAAGEQLAGMILGQDGEPDHYLILLPSENESANWADARVWAQQQGGALPTRREQSLLFANLKREFASAWYWSDEQHESDSGWAWCQSFYGGYQGRNDTGLKLRARAVRRFIPSVI